LQGQTPPNQTTSTHKKTNITGGKKNKCEDAVNGQYPCHCSGRKRIFCNIIIKSLIKSFFYRLSIPIANFQLPLFCSYTFIKTTRNPLNTDLVKWSSRLVVKWLLLREVAPFTSKLDTRWV